MDKNIKNDVFIYVTCSSSGLQHSTEINFFTIFFILHKGFIFFPAAVTTFSYLRLGKMAARVIAQIVIQGTAIFSRAFVSAYQQALQSKCCVRYEPLF